MIVSYIIHKIPKDGFFSLALSVKNADGIMCADKRVLVGPQDKKIIEALIKDFNAHKPLKTSSLEYGKLDKIPISEKQTSYFLTELAKVKEVTFESKKIVIDALSCSKLFYELSVTQDKVDIKAHIIDSLCKISLSEVHAFFGQSIVWLLHKGVLKRLKQDYKWLKIAFDNEPLTLKKKEDLLDHYENELPIAPIVPEAKFIYVKAQVLSPTPVIELTNDRGLFFKLKFDYEEKGQFYFDEAPPNILNKDDELFWEKVLLEMGVKKNSQEYFISSLEQEKLFQKLIQEGFLIQHISGKKVVLIEHITSSLVDKDQELEFEIEISHHNQRADLTDIMSATLKKTPLVSLGKDTFGLVPLSLLSDLEVIFRGQKRGQKIALKPQQKGDFLIKSFNVCDKTQFELGNIKFDHFSLNLLEFQKQGVAWMLSHIQKGLSFLLADDMGLGKTIQVLALMDLIKPLLKKGILIICPKSLKAQWKESIHTHLKEFDIFIEIKSFHELRASAQKFDYSLTIIDEAQGIKNSSTLIFQKCCEIQSDYKIALSGTPIENSLKDLVTIFEFLSPDLVEEFRGMNASIGAVKINRRLAPFIKRRLKQEVLHELPELFEQECLIEMGETQSLVYHGLIQEAKNNPIHAFSLLTRLRLAALDERLIDPTHAEMSSKTWQVIEDIKQIHESHQKVIVFSQFTSYLALIKEHLEELGLDYAYLDGTTEHRDQVIQAFQGDKNILVMSLKAGGVGLNLQVADYVLLLDPWWNEAIEKQAIDRAYRLGRQKPVVAKRYLSLGTLETKIKELKASKMILLDELETSNKFVSEEILHHLSMLN
jgi:SNF2 family DNA or RNA helicase